MERLKYKQTCELHICKNLPINSELLGILDLRVEEREKGVALSAAPFCFAWFGCGLGRGEEDGSEQA